MTYAQRFTALLLTSACIASLAACGGRHNSDEKYYLVTSNISIPYWQSAKAGFFKGAEQMKIRAEVAGPDNFDPQAEKKEFERAVAAKPSGILVSAADPNLLREDIDSAISQGIPVITIDSDAPVSRRLFFIGTNNIQAGVLGGEVAAKELHGKGNVVVFTIPTQENLSDRLRGYKQVFERYPQIKITQVVDMKGDPRVVFDTAQSMIDKKEPVDGFLCLEALGGKEVANVLNSNHLVGKKVLIAMDTDPDTLDWIKKGAIAATIAQKPYTMGYFGLQMLDDYHHNRQNIASMGSTSSTMSPLPAFVDTGATLVDRSNVAALAQAQQESTAAPKK